MPFDHQNTPLSPEQARVLATLMEKQRTVPDSYPRTLNSLLSGCNQKTSREPLMQLSESDALAALDTLRERAVVVEGSGQRAMRWEHNTERVLSIPSRAAHACRALAPLCRRIVRGSIFARAARAQPRQRRAAGAALTQSPWRP